MSRAMKIDRGSASGWPQDGLELSYETGPMGENARDRLELPDSGAVFIAAGTQPQGRKGVLSRDGERICSIEQVGGPDGFWVIEK